MQEEKIYDLTEINHADYDFNFYEKKEILSKMLETLEPIKVEKFNSKGTCWNLWGEYDDGFILCINGGKMETSTCVSDFIEGLLHFLPQLAYTDDKTLICPFEYEGITTAFLTKPLENDNIRVCVFYENEIWKYSPELKFASDIVINKNTFLKQMHEILQNMVKDTISEKDEQNTWVNEINHILSELDKYFDNPEKFKQNYEPKRYIKVFDVAYKTLENKWEFALYLEGNKECSIMYWECEKRKGRILDYDFFEQNSQCIFKWNEECTELIKLANEEIKNNLETDMDNRIDRNWVYSKDTKKWYSNNEIMPYIKEEELCSVFNRLNYDVEIKNSFSNNEDEQLKSFVNDSYDIEGCLKEDNLGSLECILTLKSDNYTFTEIKFDYKNNKQIREGLEKALKGEYARFDLDDYKSKMHLWQQIYLNSDTTESRDLLVACYNNDYKEIYSFLVDKNEFIKCFKNVLDEIQHKINTTKYCLDVGNNLQVKKNFKIASGYGNDLDYIENFKGGYACVHKECLSGAGIINKNFEWVIKAEHVTILGKTHPKWGTEILGDIKKYRMLENVDGNLFIATKDDYKQCVIDINEELKLPHMRDNIYYSYLNEELFFVCSDEDKTYFVNSKGEDIFTVDFKAGKQFWLFDDIIILSKDEKYGIIDWNGNIILDFIFSDIKPDKNNLDFIPVKYFEQWGFINKNGEIIDMKIKDSKNQSEADLKCSQVK